MSSGYEYQSEFALKYVAKGREEGKREGVLEGKREGMLEGKREGMLEGKRESKAQAVLAVLEARSLGIPDEVRARVLASTELDELEHWLRRAAVVSDARELFR